MAGWLIAVIATFGYFAGVLGTGTWYRLSIPRRDARSVDIALLAAVWPLTVLPFTVWWLCRVPIQGYVKYLDRLLEKQKSVKR